MKDKIYFFDFYPKLHKTNIRNIKTLKIQVITLTLKIVGGVFGEQ